MKKYSKLIVAAIVALIFVGTFVFLYQKSQPKATGRRFRAGRRGNSQGKGDSRYGTT